MNPFSVDKADKDALWSSSTAGFSLIELLVTIAVMGVVAGMVFTQRSSFSQSIGLKNVTQEIAVAVRQAQVYGVASRGSNLGDDVDDFTYGVFFDTDDQNLDGYPRNQRFYLYRDTSAPQGRGFDDDQDTIIETYRLPDNMQIAEICVNNNFSDTDCSIGDDPGVSDVAILFSRPHPDAVVTNDGGFIIYSGGNETTVILMEEISSGSQRKVIVRSSGYITTE